jgi:hypothetical protein
MVRGGVPVGLLFLAAGSVLLEMAGIQYSVTAQVVVGAIGVLLGAFFGAYEPA